MTPTIPVSWGELIDKLTILEIKGERLRSESARANVWREHELLTRITADAALPPRLAELRAALKRINEVLWAIEDDIRAREAAQNFDAEFIGLARAVYRNNDQRGRLKREIDALLGSEIVEEKQYVTY